MAQLPPYSYRGKTQEEVISHLFNNCTAEEIEGHLFSIYEAAMSSPIADDWSSTQRVNVANVYRDLIYLISALEPQAPIQK